MSSPKTSAIGLKSKYGQTALIAGASEGLGQAYCKALAAEGFDIVMLARHADKLVAAAADLRTAYPVQVIPIVCDLADPDIIDVIRKVIAGRSIDVLVYDAGMPYIGPFLDAPVDKHIAITEVNIQGAIRLVHHFGSQMVERRRGAVIMMSSLAGFQGSGFLTTYASTKAFDRVFAESLWYEWKDKGVDVICCTAGTIATPNYLNTNPDKSGAAPAAQAPEDVVSECLHNLGKVPSFIAGSSNRMATFAMKLMPHKMTLNLMGDTTRKMYKIDY